MKRAITHLIFVFMILTHGFNASAGTWYVDNAAQGNRTGRSWENAWVTFSDIVWGASGVRAGDTLYISGGTTSKIYNESITMKSSGSADSVIAISAGQDEGHNGKVIIDGQNIRTRGLAMSSFAKVTGRVGNSKNLVFTNFVSSDRDRDTLGGAAIWGSSHSVIEYVEIASSMNGIYCSGLMNVEIRFCDLHDIRGDYGIRVNGYSGTDFSNYRIHHCTIINNGDTVGTRGGPDGIQCQNGLTMFDNVLRIVPGIVQAGQHPDGVQAMGSYHKIYNNYFANWLNSGVKCGPIIGQNAVKWTEEYIYNNIFTIDTQPSPNSLERGIEAGPDSCDVPIVSNLFILNNTFVDMNIMGITGSAGRATTVSNISIQNNLFFNCGRNSGGTVLTWSSNGLPDGCVIDYNAATGGNDGGTLFTFDSKPFVQSHQRTASPKFRTYTPRSMTNDFRLGLNDPLRGAGTNFSAWFSTDKDGRARGAAGAWTIGAYEPDPSLESPAPPVTLRIIPRTKL